MKNTYKILFIVLSSLATLTFQWSEDTVCDEYRMDTEILKRDEYYLNKTVQEFYKGYKEQLQGSIREGFY